MPDVRHTRDFGPLTPGPDRLEIVLVAEDEDSIRNLVRHLLEVNGNTVHGSKEWSRSPCDLRETRHIDLLLTDVKMPKMGGRELAEKQGRCIRNESGFHVRLHVIDTVIAEGIKVKGIKFLQKPFAAAELIHKVRDVLDGDRKTGPRG